MDETLKLLDRVISKVRLDDPEIARQIEGIRAKLSIRPMSEILDFVPGKTVAEKARACGVTRQAYYLWLRGKRPLNAQARRLSALTGYSIAEIRGSTPATTALATLALPLVGQRDGDDLAV